MQWNKGYKARYYATTVNSKTWADNNERVELTDGSVNREPTGLRGSAEITSDAEGYNERLIRIYVDAVQNSDVSHDPIFTGYAVSPTMDVEGTVATQKYTCYSVLKPADDILLERGWYAPLGANTGSLISNLLSVTNAPLTIEGEPGTLENYIVAEDNETRLTMVDKILKIMNMDLIVTGRGELILRPKKTEADVIFDPKINDIVEPSFSITNDWYDVPNVLRVIMDDVSAIARDDSETSIYSTVNRGREIWSQEESADLTAEDTLSDYARRRLKELQMVGTQVSYTRGFIPDLNVCDVVRLRYELLSGLYRITEQKISLDHKLTTSETVERIDTDITTESVTRIRQILVMPDDVIFMMPDGYIVTVPKARSLSNE